MAKSSGKSKPASGSRTRVNPKTKEVETVPGTKAGKKRTRLSGGHPLRTHDIHGVVKAKKKTVRIDDED
jgi:hypothetical protein